MIKTTMACCSVLEKDTLNHNIQYSFIFIIPNHNRITSQIRSKILAVAKQRNDALVIDVAIPGDGKIRRKEHEVPKKYQGLKEKLVTMNC